MQKSLTILLPLALASLSSGFVSNNVPLEHWSYEAVDKLIGQGLIDSAMMTTKPVSRLEMGRHIAEAIEKAQQLNEKNKIILSILDRLKKEFKSELIATGVLDGNPLQDFIKPVENPYIKYVFADEKTGLENQRGDVFDKHSNYRFGFASRMKFFDAVAFYLHPEYAYSSPDPDDIDLIEAYGKVALGSLEIEVGKDSLWWGPGYHGSMLMSNNTETFKMIKISNPHPTELPWIFRSLGPCKTVWFLTELEKDRFVPEAKLTGLRLNFKPHPAFEFGLSKAIMYGGSGKPGVSWKDYLDMWLPQPEQPETNELAGFDVSVLLPLDGKIPAKSIKLYTDFIGEDEAGRLPAKWGRLFGVQLNDIFRTGRTDLRMEYANNHVSGAPDVFYVHSVYGSGYTHKGRVIGHHMGTDTQDVSIRLTHYLTEDIILGLEYDREKGLSSTHSQTIDQYGLDLTFFTSKNWQLRTGYRYENAKNSANRPDNHILHLQLVCNF